MAVYYLFQNITAAQTAPSAGVGLPTTNPAVNPADSLPPTQNSNQAFQLLVNGTSGTVSCSAQPVVSNDGINWSNLGSALTITAAATPANTVTTSAVVYQYFGAYVVSISGTGASASMLMSS
jgi:hypothetical protein